MKIIELMPPRDSGDAAPMNAPLNQIGFVYQQNPLEPGCMVLVGDAMVPAANRLNDQLIETLDDFVLFDTPEGGRCFVNPRSLLFYTVRELGVYNLMFPGKIAIAVKTTGADLQNMISQLP